MGIKAGQPQLMVFDSDGKLLGQLLDTQYTWSHILNGIGAGTANVPHTSHNRELLAINNIVVVQAQQGLSAWAGYITNIEYKKNIITIQYKDVIGLLGKWNGIGGKLGDDSTPFSESGVPSELIINAIDRKSLV